MKTILGLFKRAGGWHPGLYLRIDNPPYMQLVIEAMNAQRFVEAFTDKCILG